MADPRLISHVSDTARWVATYRAMESERPDALFHDPFARELAGPDGERIVAALPHGRRMAWPMIVRTAVLDELITECLRQRGVEAVLNLAAGLDARPWRMDLPGHLRWTDVDHPAMIEYKTDALRNERPRCDYRTVGLDLADDAGRRGLFAELGREGRRTLVLTEGLLIYLPEVAVTGLARDLHAQPSLALWLTDLASPGLLKMLERTWAPVVAEGNAPFRFGPADAPTFFGALGWKEIEFRSIFHEGLRLKRSFRGARFWALLGKLASRRRQQELRRFSTITLMGRA